MRGACRLRIIQKNHIACAMEPVERVKTDIPHFRHVVQKDTWIIITILSQQIKQINSIEHKKLVAWIFWANQGFLLAAQHTGGNTLSWFALIIFSALQVVRSRSGLEVYREAGWKSIASYYCFPDNIFDNLRVKTLKLSSFLLWNLPLLTID